MLAIRLQRTGRSGHAQFRVIVQDSRFSPSGGRIVAYLGSYDPHTKAAIIDSQKAAKYLENGAQPSDRVAGLLKKEGVKLPAWVKVGSPKEGVVRNPDKRRSTSPAKPEEPAAEPAVSADETAPSTDEPAETPAQEAPAESAAEPEAPKPETPEPAAEPEEPAAEPVATEEKTEEPASKEPSA